MMKIITCILLLSVIHFGENRLVDLLPLPFPKVPKEINIQSIIDKVQSIRTTWKADHKSLLDIPVAALTRLLGEKELKTNILPWKKVHPEVEIPKEFDARKHWPECPTIRQVRDQGVCGACWAVATSSAFSDRACIAGLTSEPLSEVEVLSCCTDCGLGCDGGSSQLAWNYFISHGLVTGGLYNSSQGCQPYEIESCDHTESAEGGKLPPCSSMPNVVTPNCKKQCTNPDYEKSYKNDLYKAHIAYIMRNNVTEIQREILTNGPVVASMYVYADFYTYDSGVYQHVAGDQIDSHAVRILGWGTDDGVDYWLVANSWNSGWGEDGFFRIRRGVNECGIERKVTAGLPLKVKP